MSSTLFSWPLLVVTLAIAFILGSFRRKPHKVFYPPGPKPRFLTGNLFDIPSIKPWKTYYDWRKIYGDMIHLEIMGQHMVILNSRDIVERTLEKRSRIYSDRPFIPMFDVTGWTKLNSALLRYSPDWRFHRRVYQQGFRANIISDYQPIVSSKLDQFFSNLRSSPELFEAHIRTFSSATMLATVYGYDIAPTNDRLIEIAEKAIRVASDTVDPMNPATRVLTLFPSLRHLPLEYPIFEFQRIARKCKTLLEEMGRVPYEFVKSNMAAGKSKPCVLANLLEDHVANDGDDYREELIKDALTTAYAAGVETTVVVLINFCLAMALHPEIQQKAQRELDTLIGEGRLPAPEDRPNLPYVEAILRETFRWSPVFPLGVFHATYMDDVIDDYFIPKGSAVIPNIWGMTRDESVYPDPESFIPERFLNKDGTCNDDQMLLPFGFGRRMCAGRHFASATAWSGMTSLLSQFNFSEATDMEGRPIKRLADLEYSDGLVSAPAHFHCVIKQRRE